MSNAESGSKKRESMEIIKLKVEGARAAVNTLRDLKTARGVSLVCPFPSLEVDVPVSFQGEGMGEMKAGVIHRIGVEDDPETGLPRLRLSIRTNDSCSAILAEPVAPTVTVAPTVEVSETYEAEVSESFEPEFEPVEDDGPGEGPSEISSEIPLFGDEDPAWVGCTDVPMPEEFAARAKTRRRYKLAGRAVLMAAVALFVAGGYVLERTGFVDSKQIRSYIAGFSMDSIGLLDRSPTEQTASVAPVLPVAEEPAEAAPVAEPTADSPAPEAEPAPAPVETVAAAEPETAGPAEIRTASAAVPDETETPESPVAEAPEAIEPAPSPEEAVVMLPTRWPVEYATGYRVRNPNGIVVDVPGGLVKREGWIEAAAAHEMVRSVKAVQRETGARFIIYVHGSLPRFMTSPKSGGVSLRLYHPESDATATDKVAVLD